MYESNDPIDNLVHLYVDGAFNRRDLIRRVARHTGSLAAAMAALSGYEVLKAQPPSACPAGVRVPPDAPDLEVYDVEFPGEAGTMFGHLAYPRSAEPRNYPAVIVVHENRGLLDHHKDVTRRAARAGFVGLGVDLLSRQGGTQKFPDPTQQTQAFRRTTQDERRSDLIAGLTYLKTLGVVRYDRIGIVGFCAGGDNVWDFIVNVEETAAAVPFYGAPPTLDQLEKVKTPVLGIYAERDPALSMRVLPIADAMLRLRKTVGLFVYEGVGHAFHNDTGAAYNAEAACDAWARTIAFFNKYLRAA